MVLTYYVKAISWYDFFNTIWSVTFVISQNDWMDLSKLLYQVDLKMVY